MAAQESPKLFVRVRVLADLLLLQELPDFSVTVAQPPQRA